MNHHSHHSITKLFLILISLFIATNGFAQTQYGYVKTRGRLDSKGNLIPGEGLKGAVVSIKNHTSAIVKNDDGVFSFPIPEKQFCIDSVRKKGYQLVDMDFCYKTRQYSSTPLDILMEVPGQSIEDYMEDFNRINTSQQAMINQLRKEVKQLKAQNKINEEEYSRRLAEIAEMQSESQKLVSEMAERYSKMDWDRLDEFNRQVGWLIHNGELIKADSLINSQGSMEALSAELDSIHNANEKEKTEIDERTEKWEKSKKYEAKQLESFASKCYSKHEICKLRHDNDSAAYWLELRASKDTTNVEWQIEAGLFFSDYIADYGKALHYYQLGLRQAVAQFGERSSWGATFYNNIGFVYHNQGDYSKALEYYNKDLAICKSVFGENHPNVATSYNNIGGVYSDQGDYGKALEYHNKALAIWKSVFGETHPNVATSYNNIGSAYHGQGNYNKALEYDNIALTIRKSVFGENHLDVATSFNNIGSVYLNQGDYSKAIEYYNKALTVLKTVLGENHPNVATSYNNIGSVHYRQGDYNKALEYYNKALIIRKSVFGENHPDVAKSYNNIGSVYYNQDDDNKALEYYNKALVIRKSVLGENHPDVATSYNNISSVYLKKGDYIKTLEYSEQALAIEVINLGDDHPIVLEHQQILFFFAIWEYKECVAANSIETFFEKHCFTVIIVDDNTPASQQGMSGEYILLEFADWNQDSPTSLFDKNDELRGKPKDILVMKDGQIKQHHFENIIGAQLGIKNVGKEEKQKINKAYEEWKKQNRKQP